MLKKLLQGLLYTGQLIKGLLTLVLHSDFIPMLVICGSCLALLSLVTGELAVAYLSAAFLIMFLIPGTVYLLIMMRIYGWQAQVEGSVVIGAVFGVMVWIQLTVVSLLVLSPSCMS